MNYTLFSLPYTALLILVTLVTAATIALLHRYAAALGLVALPGDHKTHLGLVPAVGGVGIAVGWAVVVAGLTALSGVFAMIAGFVLLLCVGVLDDRRGLPTTVRFAAQIAAALLMALVADVELRDFGELLLPGRVLGLSWFAIPATVFCVVGVINALNMIDGIDGLSGSIAGLVLIAMAVLAATAGQALVARWLIGLALGVMVFLAFNVRVGSRTARVFLGNAGSLTVGFVLAWFLVSLSQGPQRAFAPVTALWLFAVPLIDTVSVMWRRLTKGSSPFDADHEHVHHLLLRAGYSVQNTLVVLVLAAALFAAIGLLAELRQWPEAWRFYGFLAVAFVYHALSVRVSRRLGPIVRA